MTLRTIRITCKVCARPAILPRRQGAEPKYCSNPCRAIRKPIVAQAKEGMA